MWYHWELVRNVIPCRGRNAYVELGKRDEASLQQKLSKNCENNLKKYTLFLITLVFDR